MKKLTILLCGCLVFGFMANADPDELAELQKILQATRSSWQAGETSVSQMTPYEQEALLGLLPGISDIRNLPEETIEEMPVRAEEYITPHTSIKNQGNCGSCYSFGACASYESNKLLNDKETFDLSEQWFMMKAKDIGPYGGCKGWYLDKSMDLLKDHGTAAENDCKYLATEKACPSEAKAKFKIKSYARTTDINTIKKALHDYGAVYVGFAVFSDFSYYKTGYYEHKSGYKRGYHAVAIVGYDKEGWKVKNSWGTGWGDNGYFWIKYNQMDNDVEFGKCFGGSFYIDEK